MTKVLIVAPHPDDETLGCGGTLLKHASSGDELFWLIVTKTWEPLFDASQIERHAQQIGEVENAYPFKHSYRLGFPTTRLDTVPMGDLVDAMRVVLGEVHPQIVYVPNYSDAHSDHRITFDAVMSVLKPSYASRFGVSRVLAYETMSETEAAPAMRMNPFAPTVYSDISDTLKRKLEVMQLYETELQSGPMPRTLSALEALHRYRGATIGVDYAEAFASILEVQN